MEPFATNPKNHPSHASNLPNRRIISAIMAAVIVLAAGASRSASLVMKTGLETISGNFSYVQGKTDGAAMVPPHFLEFKDVSDSYIMGVVGLGADLVEPVGDNCFMGLSLSAGVPTQSFPFDMAKLLDPEPGTVNMNEGDESRGNMGMVKLMVNGGYRTTMGPGEASLKLGSGVVVYSLAWKAVDQYWNGMMGVSPVKLFASDVPYARVTTYSTSTAAVPAIEATPGYYWKIGEKYKIGVEVPLSLSAKRKLIGTTTGPLDAITGVFASGNMDCNVPVVEVGGFNFAAYVVFCRASI